MKQKRYEQSNEPEAFSHMFWFIDTLFESSSRAIIFMFRWRLFFFFLFYFFFCAFWQILTRITFDNKRFALNYDRFQVAARNHIITAILIFFYFLFYFYCHGFLASLSLGHLTKRLFRVSKTTIHLSLTRQSNKAFSSVLLIVFIFSTR